jgi:hypothetical protein
LLQLSGPDPEFHLTVHFGAAHFDCQLPALLHKINILPGTQEAKVLKTRGLALAAPGNPLKKCSAESALP